MRNLKVLLALFLLSFVAIIVTGAVLNYIGIEHGSLLIKIGFIFLLVNIVLYLLLLIFFVGRHLFNVYNEKKRKALGSKFRTKLVTSFLGLVLIPAVLLFLLSTQLINNSIDTWFSLEVQKPIYDSMDIAKTLYNMERGSAKHYSEMLASNNDLLNKALLSKDATQKFRIYRLTVPDGSILVREAFKGTSDTDITSSEKGDIIRAASPIIIDKEISGVVVVETILDKEIVGKMESVQNSFNEYIQIKLRQTPIRQLYFLLLTIAALLIIFLALWVSLRIARGITVPIQSLAEATMTVAHGNLDFRIARDRKRDDEIGILTDSFNAMLDEIQNGKISLEMAYKESDRRRLSMETILETIHTGVIFFDRTGKIRTLNNAACKILSIERSAIEGKSHRELVNILKSDELSTMVRRLTEKGFGAMEKEIHFYINGRPMDFRVYIAIIKDRADKFVGTLVVFDNLTEVIMAQRALAWQEVAKRIAHEIKNPLTPIRLSAERLLKKWNDKAEDFGEVLNRSSKIIVREVDSLRSLVDEFSRFGKMPKITLETTNIKSVIDEVVDLYNELKRPEISVILNSHIPPVEIDRNQIRMALINLIDNAIQAKTENIWINVFYNNDYDLIRIELSDDGTGIKEEDKEKLFFPYFSTKKEGTGLGLAIVNSIISKHHGYIRVQDNMPKGTQFIIELPVGQK